MKKIIFALFAILCFSSNLMAEKPIINIKKEGGKAHYNSNQEIIKVTFLEVYSSQNSTGAYNVTCKGNGDQECCVIIGETNHCYPIPRFNNPEITYEFDAALINEIADNILSEIDNGCFQRGELSGSKTIKVGMYDVSGKFHYVNFLATYNLNELGDGDIAFYINVIE